MRGVLPLLGRLGLESDGPGRGGHFFLVFLDATRVASFDALIMLIRFGAHLPARLWHPQGGCLWFCITRCRVFSSFEPLLQRCVLLHCMESPVIGLGSCAGSSLASKVLHRRWSGWRRRNDVVLSLLRRAYWALSFSSCGTVEVQFARHPFGVEEPCSVSNPLGIGWATSRGRRLCCAIFEEARGRINLILFRMLARSICAGWAVLRAGRARGTRG